MRELKGIEEKILDRALYLFGKNGTSNVPVRTIVKEAGVNVSAINYYFGSKDKMLSYVKKFYLKNIILAYSHLYDESISDEEKLIKCANEIIEYSLSYPGVLVMNKEASSAKEKDEMDIEILEKSKEVNEKLISVLSKVLNCSDDDFMYKRIIFFASITYPAINESGANHNKVMGSEEVRINYIKKLIKLLKEEK